MAKYPFLIKNNLFDSRIVFTDYLEYSGKSGREVKKTLDSSLSLANQTWHQLVPQKTLQNLGNFYASANYLYALLLPFYYPHRFNKIKTCLNFVNFVKTHPGNKVLEFGGGTGQLCLLLHFNTGKSVTYLDLPGKIMDFAAWRFQKYGAKIKIIKAQAKTQAIPNGPYDFIVSDAVLEHVPDLKLTLTRIVKALTYPGWCYLIFDPDVSSQRPMHINKFTDFYKLMAASGLRQIGKDLWTNDQSLATILAAKVFAASLTKNKVIILMRTLGGKIKRSLF
ncbi:hypothetical protein A2160_02035 [Candidatus Beckwithbacteria bacterium RBG_13_42_9]|uniref:Methyltransferase type 12 domain-containing protein n=1 Tax=Candidatus Beckwithbacteria bacterium RBG_13_42_9 TaxID=1797457 RepID=A0A1F5E7B9_9BACT|nr:MAG: hypothetical protein A2160_02035 [Candidatus Beckwithbacteria bacterium RBG_13_42_9]